MSCRSTGKTAKAKSVERIYQDLDEMPAQARRKETLTALNRHGGRRAERSAAIGKRNYRDAA